MLTVTGKQTRRFGRLHVGRPVPGESNCPIHTQSQFSSSHKSPLNSSTHHPWSTSTLRTLPTSSTHTSQRGQPLLFETTSKYSGYLDTDP